jgi:hypothetical protein
VEAVSNDCTKDRRVLATILCVVPLEMKVELAVKKSMKEACDAVRSMRANDDHVKSASLQLLLKKYENIAFHDRDSIDDFVMRINRFVAGLPEL